MRVTIEVSTAQACNDETAHYLVIIYVLLNRSMRNISYIASNIGQYLKIDLESVETELVLANLLSVHVTCLRL
jgi:hypothetical protein